MQTFSTGELQIGGIYTPIAGGYFHGPGGVGHVRIVEGDPMVLLSVEIIEAAMSWPRRQYTWLTPGGMATYTLLGKDRFTWVQRFRDF